MPRLIRSVILAGLLLGAVVAVHAQQAALPQPRINSIFPLGGRTGASFELTINGTDLDEVTGLLFSHPGIKAELIVAPEPKPDPKAKPDTGKKKKSAGIPASVKFRVMIASDVPVGQYDVRIVNRWGISNPRAFVIGDRPEVDELEPNNDVNDYQSLEAGVGSLVGGPMTVPGPNAPRAQRIELGTTINGLIATATDVDYSVFFGKANQRVLISCLTSSIDSKSRPLIEVFTAAGRRIGQNRNYAGADALCDVTLPADGDYFVRLSEFAYEQGGPDYFYRLTVGTGPWIDAVYPPAINPGKPTSVTLYGRNLPGGQPVPGMQIDGRPVESLTVTVTPPSDPAARTRFNYRGRVAPTIGLQDAFEYRLSSPSGSSNAVPIYLTDLPVVLEKPADNDKPEGAEAITPPVEIAGRIEKRYDRDYYTFTAKKGDVLTIEVIGEQSGSIADLYLRVRDEKNKEIAGELDDDPESLHPTIFFTRSGDPPPYKFTAPADGKYLILVGSIDANVSYGPRCSYRLRVTPPVPDYRAVVMARGKELPSTVTARPDGEVAYDVFIHRTGGFTGPVTVSAENLPAGVTAKPALIGTGMKWGTLVLSAAAGAADYTGPISVKATADIAGKPVARDARPATITWGVPNGQNTPTVSRLDQQLYIAVRADRSTFRLSADLAASTVKTKDKDGKEKDEKVAAGPLFLKPGDKLTIPVKVTWNDKEARANPLNVVMEPTLANMQNAPLTVNNNQPVALAVGKNDGTVVVDVKANAVPGTYAVVLRGDVQINFLRDPEMKDKKTPVTVQGYAAPIEVTVLPLSLGKFTATPPGSAIKAGTAGEITVKVERQFDYAGEYQISVELPKDTKSVTTKSVVLPAGKDEIKIPVEAAKDAKAGGIPVIIRATATVHGKYPVNHEAKLNLNIAAAK